MFQILYSNEKHPEHWELYHETESRDAANRYYNQCIHELELISDYLHVKIMNPKGETIRFHSNE